MSSALELNILFVEDDPVDYKQYLQVINEYFSKEGITINIDPHKTFKSGIQAVNNPHLRYDLVISDTYLGPPKNRNAPVLRMVNEYRENNKFCPLIIISSGSCPDKLDTSAFVQWVEKTHQEYLISALDKVLGLRIPQLARSLHVDIDKAAGSYLWGFLEKNWDKLETKSPIGAEQLERIIRSRAALIIGNLKPEGENYSAISERYGLEYYIYPSLEQRHFSLGDILRNKADENDFRVILTPHCHLVGPKPKASHVLTVETVSKKEAIGKDFNKAMNLDGEKKNKKLREFARSPIDSFGKPAGRYWYLPKFLEIPHLYCDFLKTESIEHEELFSKFDRIATLASPFTEALQQCFSRFYGSVGIPEISPESIKDLLDS